MKKDKNSEKESLLALMTPSKAIIELAVPATLAFLEKAVYNIVDTAYIGMLNSDLPLQQWELRELRCLCCLLWFP